MNKNNLFFALALFFIACEEDITVELPAPEEKIVVEGHIEQGLPPYVILSKNAPYFSPTDINTLKSLFVHNAEVKVSDGLNTVTLNEFCMSSLSDSLKPLVTGFLGISMDYLNAMDYCVYSTFDISIWGVVGKTYDLTVNAEGKKLTATTGIPYPVPLDSLWYVAPSDPDNDSMVVFWTLYNDPDTLGNLVRYFTKRNNEPFYPGYFSSVTDDKFFNGEKLDFPLDRGQSKTDKLNFDTYGYFWRGDTVIVKWCMINRPHYDFWRTLEQEFNNTGNPFGSPTIVLTNIDGGLGIWGGYAAYYDTLIVSP